MARALTREERARRYLQASMSAGYTGLPKEHREAYEEQLRGHERAYAGVREHALVGSDQDFDKPLTAGEREHQRSLRDREGLQHADVLRMRRELRQAPQRSPQRRPANLRERAIAGARPGARAGRAAAGGAAGAIAGAAGGRGSTPLYLLGVALGLSLVYLLVAGKGTSALRGVVGVLVGGVRAFIAPVDPIAGVEQALGAEPINRTSSSPTSSSSTVASAGNPGPTAGGKTALAPSAIRLPTSTHGLPPASLLRADLQLRAQSRRLIGEHKLTPSQAIAREEHLIPRSKYPAFYAH